MKVILDVSAAFAVITGAPASGQFFPKLTSAVQVTAPEIYYSEAANTAWKFHHIEGLSPAESMKLAERAIQLVDIYIPSDALWKEALALACETGHPCYDCYYLVLAQQQEAVLLTLDRRLIRIAKQLEISVVEIS